MRGVLRRTESESWQGWRELSRLSGPSVQGDSEKEEEKDSSWNIITDLLKVAAAGTR